MATLWVKDGFQAEFDRKINSYTSKITDINDQYYKASQTINAYAGDSDVSSCNVYLKKRRAALQDAVSTANTLKRKVNNYVDNVVNADISVSKSIHKESYAFYKKKGIGPKNDTWGARAWNSIKTTASDFWHDAKGTTKRIVQDIKEFYDEYKYFFNIAADILKITAALALFAVSGGTFLGIICFIGAAWALSKATYELCTDLLALHAWSEGDIGRAESLSNSTLSNVFISGGEWLDKTFNTNFFENVVKGIVIGLEVCEFVATVMLLFDAFKEIFNLKQRYDGKPLTVLDHTYKATFKESVINWKLTKFGGTKGNGLRFLSPTNWIKFSAWTLGFSFKKDATNIIEFNLSILENSAKNGERIKKIYNNPQDILADFPGIKQGNKLGETIANVILV